MTAMGLSLVTRAPVISNNGSPTGAAVVIPAIKVNQWSKHMYMYSLQSLCIANLDFILPFSTIW